jgi:hypothetical protein
MERLARVVSVARPEESAGVLPSLLVTVPMESKFGEAEADLDGGHIGKGHPDAAADNPSGLVQAGKGLGQFPQELRSREPPVAVALLEVDRREFVGSARHIGEVLSLIGSGMWVGFHRSWHLLLCHIGFGLSPFTDPKPAQRGRPVGVVFRGHHEGPLAESGG